MLQLISRFFALLVLCCYAIAVTPSQAGAPAAPKSPAEGYNIHVSAPHVMDGHVGGPYHHYCKVMQPEPVQIVCLIYDTTDANAPLSQVEYIQAKSLTRNNLSRADWNKLWHDHTQEIATGRVQVHDMAPDQAKQVADLVSTTDGIIFGFELGPKNIPTGRMMRGQSVGHRPLSEAEFRASQTPAKPGGNK